MAVRDVPRISQKKIGGMTHLSSSMVNNYIRDLKEEGLLNVTGETNRSQSYHLTPKGQEVLRESLLSYSAEIVQLYASVKREIAQILEAFYKTGTRTVGLFGVADTAEIVHAAVKKTPLVVISVVDSDEKKQGKPFNGLIIQAPRTLMESRPDAVIITSFGQQEGIEEQIHRMGFEDMQIIRLSNI